VMVNVGRLSWRSGKHGSASACASFQNKKPTQELPARFSKDH
jgi:hypothetical protein